MSSLDAASLGLRLAALAAALLLLRRRHDRRVAWLVLLVALMTVREAGLLIAAVRGENTFPVHRWEEASALMVSLLILGLVVLLDRIFAGTERAERALRESEALHRSLVELSPDAIGVYHGDRLEFANAALTRLLGARRAEELTGRSILDFVHPSSREAVAARMRLLEQTDEPVPPLEQLLLRVDGTPVPADVTAAGVRRGEKPAKIQLVARDASARHAAEAERKRFEAELRRSQTMEALGRLAGGIAHDFNNLLTAILGYTDLVARGLAPDHPVRAEVDEIQTAATRGAELTARLLAFGRPEEGRPSQFDLNQVVRDVESLLRRLIGDAVTLSLDLDAEAAAVEADRGQIERVLVNLVLNARDATPRGGRIEIATRRVDPESIDSRRFPNDRHRPHVALQVSDTGSGMDEATKRRAFEPFFSTHLHQGGTGLGLATVYAIVDQCGGFIHVESDAGRGSRFEVLLPRVPKDEAAADECTASGRPPRTSETLRLGGTERVLVVEDEPAVRRLVSGTLRSLGYRVLEASNGLEALEAAGTCTDRIDLLVTDVVMPGLRGPDLAARLQGARRHLRVLYISGYEADAFAPAGAQNGALLRKPFTGERLARAVRAALDGPAAPPAASEDARC